jgi:hypothetical protein
MSEQGSKVRLLSADEILGADDLDYIDVLVPEWTPPGQEPASVRLRSMSAGTAMQFAVDVADGQKRQQAMVRLLVECAIGEDGEPLFAEEHLEALQSKSFKVFQRLQNEALKLNGFATEEGEEEGEAEKND